jgi:hypothetical protein
LAFQLVNTGGSAAHIIRGDAYLLAVSAQGTNDIHFIESAHGIIENRTLQPGEREYFEDTLDFMIVADAEWADFHQGKPSIHSLFLSGGIWYRDDLSIPREAGVHRKYDPENHRFVPQKDSEEDYSD